MESTWNGIKNYYITLGRNYHVDPLIFFGIHVVATPLFMLTVAWLIKNYRQKKPIALPFICALLIFNAANIYLVIFSKNIPLWVYFVLAITTIISGYFSYKKIHKKINTD